ncbi:MAG: DUF362 domain-containing protein [Promethearchaeota archaeon]
MTIFADYCFMFQIGLLFSIMTYDQLNRSKSIFQNKYFIIAVIYITLFCIPLSILCYIIYPDWCWMYWIDSSSIPIWAPVLAFFLYYIFFIIGFWIGFLAEKKRRGRALTILFISLIYLIIFNNITYDRLFYVGTIEQYNSGNIPKISSLPIWFFIIFFTILFDIIALMIILYKLGKELDVPWSEHDQVLLDKRKRVVSLTKAEKDIKASILTSLAHWNGKKYIRELLEKRNNNVIIKPNFSGGGKDKEGTQTSLNVLSAVIEIVKEISPRVNIVVVESDSIFWDVDVLLKNSKYEKFFSEKNVKFLNLSKGKKTLHDFGGRMGVELVSKILFESHILIDMPVAKTHSFYKMTGAIKNLFGLLPAKHKLLRYHSKGFADNKGRIFIDIYRNFPPDLVILDGVVSCEGNGPYGIPKNTNFIITSDDAISTDIILAQIMGFHQKNIPYLNILYKEGLKCEVKLLGETIESIKPLSWKHAKAYGFIINVLKIWADNLKVRVLEHKNRRFVFIVFITLLFALIIEMINVFAIKWWIYSHSWTFTVIMIIWLLLGIILAFLNRIDKKQAAGPAFAIWGLIIETLNLLFFNIWAFTSFIALIGTYIVWIIFGFLIYFAQIVYLRLKGHKRRR